MYPRNAASPEPIAIGQVVQISDGAIQTSGVTVRIKPVGVAEANGAGTTAYSTDGVVLYTPTQAETDYTSFVVIASKTGCFAASQTVITSASNTPGYAGLDWSKIGNATSTVALTSTTISTSQVVASVTAAVTVGTNNDKTGYSLAISPPTAAAIADAVWDEAHADHTTDGTYGDSVLIGANSNRTVQVTGSNHVAADIHELQAGVITAADFSPDWFTAAGIAADAVTEIQSGLATSANQVILIDRVSYALTALVGACSDAQTAAETYTLSIGGNTYTLDYSGLDASGNRSTTTLSKA